MDTIQYALQSQNELKRELKRSKNQMPTNWIVAKMRQLGLETFVHNFTAKYPLGGDKVITGQNVYGILRASRIAASESFAITAPYRRPNSLEPTITHSIPLLLAYAKHARSNNNSAGQVSTFFN